MYVCVHNHCFSLSLSLSLPPSLLHSQSGDDVAHPSPLARLKRHSMSFRESPSSTPPTKPAAKVKEQEEQEESDGMGITCILIYIDCLQNYLHCTCGCCCVRTCTGNYMYLRTRTMYMYVQLIYKLSCVW